MKKTTIFILILIFYLLGFSSFANNTTKPYTINPNTKRVVRVGWFDCEENHPSDKLGNYIGFDYEYLQAISQYNNWEYEYVTGSWSQCLSWLKEGNIDLLGFVCKTPEREKIYDFSSSSVGEEFCNIFALSENKNYSYNDFKKFNNMKIACEKDNLQKFLLDEFAKKNRFNFIPIFYDDINNAKIAVKEGKADAILVNSTNDIPDFKMIAQFSPLPFFYAVKKGDDALLKELNYAMDQISTYNPTFATDLKNKYYSRKPLYNLNFTKEELDYIKKKPKISVFYHNNSKPLEYKNKSTGKFEGIYPILMKLIEKNSGLEFEEKEYDTTPEIMEYLRYKPYNCISFSTYDYGWAARNGLNITQPIVNSPIVKVSSKNENINHKIAVIDSSYITNQIKSVYPKAQLVYFDNIEQCLNAINNNIAGTSFVNIYTAEYYMNDSKYKNLGFHITDKITQPLTIGITKNSDPLLFSIISKSLLKISKENIDDIVYSKTLQNKRKNLDFFINSYKKELIIIFATVLSTFLFLTYYHFKKSYDLNKQASVQLERYNQLINITGEYIYEYSYLTDTIIFKNIPENFNKWDSKIEHYSERVKQILNNGEKFENTFFSLISQKEDSSRKLNIRCNNGQRCWFEINTKIIKDENSKPIYAIGKLKDINDSETEKEMLKNKASMDLMTGLYNSFHFKNLVSDNLDKKGSFLIIDIDDFKNINDICGHNSGDNAIIQLANVLKNCCRDTDFVGRVGGDEFALYLVGLEKKEYLETFLDNLFENVSKIKLDCKLSSITISCGAYIVKSNEDYREIFNKADNALYAVKRDGKGNYKIFS